MEPKQKKIAIFASGGGSNALKIIQHFENNTNITVDLIISNKRNAGVFQKANDYRIDSILLNKTEFYQSDTITNLLIDREIDLIVLAGFLWLIPSNLIEAFPNQIINIHPALLPKYGGKGMYGHFVHEAVKQAKEKESGITIHYVNKKYDEGHIILQKKCALLIDDTAEEIAEKVLKIEHQFFAPTIESILSHQ